MSYNVERVRVFRWEVSEMMASRKRWTAAAWLLAVALAACGALAADAGEKGFEKKSPSKSVAPARTASEMRKSVAARSKTVRDSAVEKASERPSTPGAAVRSSVADETRKALENRVSQRVQAPARPKISVPRTAAPVRESLPAGRSEIRSNGKSVAEKVRSKLSERSTGRGVLRDRSVYNSPERAVSQPSRPAVLSGTGSRQSPKRPAAPVRQEVSKRSAAPTRPEPVRLPAAPSTVSRGSATVWRTRDTKGSDRIVSARKAAAPSREVYTRPSTTSARQRLETFERSAAQRRTVTGRERHVPSAADTLRDRLARLSTTRRNYYDRKAHEYHYRDRRYEGHKHRQGQSCLLCPSFHYSYSYWWPTYWRPHYHWRPATIYPVVNPYWYWGPYGSRLTLGYYDDNWSVSLSYNQPYSYYTSNVIYSTPPVVRNYYVYDYSDYNAADYSDPVIVAAYDGVTELIVTLKYGDVGERRAAAKGFGELLSLRALYPLIYALEYDEDALVRFYAARSLGRLGSRDALKPLMRAMDEDPEEAVRVQAADAVEDILQG